MNKKYKIPIKANETWIDDLVFNRKMCSISNEHGLTSLELGCENIYCTSCFFYKPNFTKILIELIGEDNANKLLQ